MGSDKLARISATFPELNANWLLLGRGNMLLDCENNGIVQEEEQAEYKINHSSEMQIKLLEALIKEKDELIAEKERLIQILMKSNEKS